MRRQIGALRVREACSKISTEMTTYEYAEMCLGMHENASVATDIFYQ